MDRRLTTRQRQVLDLIKERIRSRGYPPSVREIGQAIGLNSSSTVHGHLNRLERKGYIRRDPTKPRAIEVLEPGFQPSRKRVVDVPLVGRIAAGEPVLAEENVEDTFPLPLDFLGDEGVFLLRVQGQSMVEAGIHDGDYVIVRQQPTARNGDIVAALVGDEAVVKRFYRERDHVRLQPENRLLSPIIVREVQILGKVTGLLRRLA